MTSRVLRSLSSGLLTLLLAACVNPGPASAVQAGVVPLGIDLGGAPARAAPPADPVAATPAAMSGMTQAPARRGPGTAQMAHDGHAGTHGTGTVTAVNAGQRRIGLNHEPIPALGWPSMVMEFTVAPSVDLAPVKPGSRINFTIEKGAAGMYMIQSLQPAGAAR